MENYVTFHRILYNNGMRIYYKLYFCFYLYEDYLFVHKNKFNNYRKYQSFYKVLHKWNDYFYDFNFRFKIIIVDEKTEWLRATYPLTIIHFGNVMVRVILTPRELFLCVYTPKTWIWCHGLDSCSLDWSERDGLHKLDPRRGDMLSTFTER